MKQIKSSNNTDKNLILSAKILRDEISNMRDELPQPPQPDDLNAEDYKLPSKLNILLESLLNGKYTSKESPRVARLKLSFGQDLVYAVSCGKIKTPKSILYPYTIKSLTNNTELITLTNRFGHGVSYSILEELETENALLQLEKARANEGIVLPDGCNKNTFSIMVADNIDRLEETLTGKNYMQQFKLT